MSRENVEAYERAFEAFGKKRDVDALLPALDPAIEWDMQLQTLLGGEAAVYRGHEGVRQYFRDMDEVFAEIELDYPDVRAVGDRVLAIGVVRARGRKSGALIESQVGMVVEARDGKATRVMAFMDPEEALKAVGLQEPS